MYFYLKCRSNLIFLAFSTLANSTFRNLLNSFVDTFSFSALRKTFQENKHKLLYMRSKMLVIFLLRKAIFNTSFWRGGGGQIPISLHKQSWGRLFQTYNFLHVSPVTLMSKLRAEYTVNWQDSLSVYHTQMMVLCPIHSRHFLLYGYKEKMVVIFNFIYKYW